MKVEWINMEEFIKYCKKIVSILKVKLVKEIPKDVEDIEEEDVEKYK